jgi:NADPH:quinone reductase-like Zn-dependent oxidoreductase
LGNPDLGGMLRGLITSKTTSKRVISQLASYKKEDLDYLKKLIEDGKILVEIDKRYPLDQLADAHYYVDAGKKKGNVIIDVGNCREN